MTSGRKRTVMLACSHLGQENTLVRGYPGQGGFIVAPLAGQVQSSLLYSHLLLRPLRTAKLDSKVQSWGWTLARC